MSAINVIVKPEAVHMLTDALFYKDGVPQDIDLKKAHPIAGMRAAIAATGPAMLGFYLLCFIEEEFSSFDDLVANGSDRIKELFFQHVRTYRVRDDVATVVLIGWHERENRPACYSIDLTTGGEKQKWVRRNRHSSDEDWCRDLTEQPLMAMPCPTLDEFTAAGFRFGADLEQRSPESVLMHIMEIQRRMRSIDGHYCVGGHAVATTVSEMGVTQRIVHTWPEDKVGEPIAPREIDWAAWRRERERPAFRGLSGSGG
jgi:hypothetical protein